ncbi:DMT family transporter [Aeribacillus pallidus]|uniref:DMT family transporter n=1 Tax=Aeribacillus pallidus TaxID=33936 RepID=UPI003D1BC5CC
MGIHQANLSAKTHATLKMVVSMVIFGSIGYFTVLTDLRSYELVFVRCISATVFLILFWLLTGKYKAEQWSKKEVLQALACGFFLVFNWVFLFKSFENTSITVAISVYHLAPVLVLILGAIFYRERLTLLSVTSIILCFIGTVFISDLNAESFRGQGVSAGIKWGLLAALFYAMTTLLSKGIQKLSPYATTFIQTGLGVILLLPLIHLEEFHHLTASNWLAVTTTGIVHTGIVYLLFFDSVRNLSTKIISVLVFLDPAVAILLDTIFLGFRPNALQNVGMILIYSGMALTLVKSKQTKVERVSLDS